MRRGHPLAGRSGYGISIQIWQYRLADFLPAADPLLQQQGPVLLQTHMRKQKISLEEMIFDQDEVLDSPADTPRDTEQPVSAVRLRSGDVHLQLPSFVEIHGEPTEYKVVDELKSWGHDCLALQFVGHHEFLCLSPDRLITDNVYHYIFGTVDGTNPEAAFLHSHKGAVLTELDCMKVLHNLGFLKTTIQEVTQCLPDVFKVAFVHQVSTLGPGNSKLRLPTPWPDRLPEHLRQPHRPSFCRDGIPEECGPCKLSLGVDLDVIENLFSPHEFPLCTTFEGLQLPQSTIAAEGFSWTESCDLSAFERIVIYTDGSSMSHMRHQPPALSDEQGLPDTWAFLALGERYLDDQCQIHLIGWQAQPVHYDSSSRFHVGTDRVGSDASEKEGLFWAALWRLSINLDIPTVFCTDSLISCGQASGCLSTNDYQSPFIMLRSAFQALEACLPGPKLEVRHVTGHSQDPWNDFVDYAAKTERDKSFYLPRPRTFDASVWCPILPYLWMILAKDSGLPQFTQQGFDAPAPALPRKDLPLSQTQLQPTVSCQADVTYVLSLATVNVLSLSVEPAGHSGKVDFLRQQFHDACLNILGIQEARSTQRFSLAGDVVRIASGASRGHHGIELWISLRQPYAFVGNQPQFFHRRHFTVRHADPRILLVAIDAPFLHALVLVGHGPQSGQTLSDRSAWWQLCNDLCTRHRTNESQHFFALFDANAAAGTRDDLIVGEFDDKPSVSTPLLRTFLSDQELCLPSTFHSHVGKHTTWTSPAGDLQCRIDHVAVPQPLRFACEFSIVDETFDLRLTHLDHELVGIQLRWHESHPQLAAPKQTIGSFERNHLCRDSLKHAMQNYQIPAWDQDIEHHVDHFNEYAITAMGKSHPRQKSGPKKPYCDAETWALRANKLRSRRALREVQSRRKLEAVFQALRAWKGQLNNRQQLEDVYSYSTTLICGHVRCVAHFYRAAHQLKTRLRQAKTHLLQQKLAQLPQTASAGQVLQAIHKFHGPTNPKKLKMKPFPQLKMSDGSHCASSSQRCDRWAEFFCNMEGGKRLTHAELRGSWISNLEHFRLQSFDLCLTSLPTLCDLERAFSHVRIGRAVGMDLIPPEACRYNVREFAKATFSQLLKMTLHGQEAIPHKGGRLTAAYKGKGDTDECASYRSLLVSSQIGKCLHRTLRTAQSCFYENFLQHQQLGGGQASLFICVSTSSEPFCVPRRSSIGRVA